MDDEAALGPLVARARAGDDEALGEVYRRLRPRVRGLCRHLLRSPEAAEDAASEAFLRVRRALAAYDPAQPFVRWVFSIASHHCLDLLRRRRLEGRLFVPEEDGRPGEAAPDAAAPSPLSAVPLAERADAVREAVRGLPERYRVPLVLRYYGELGYEEIAAQLGLTRNHVATLLFRAKHALRRALAAAERESGRCAATTS
jgi:RNA polymerase sigma-70 factor (ECF subfamily)